MLAPQKIDDRLGPNGSFRASISKLRRQYRAKRPFSCFSTQNLLTVSGEMAFVMLQPAAARETPILLRGLGKLKAMAASREAASLLPRIVTYIIFFM